MDLKARHRFLQSIFGLLREAVSSKPIFWAYQSDGKIELNFKELMSSGAAIYADKLGKLLNDIGFFPQPSMREMNYPRIPISIWGPRLQESEHALEQSFFESVR